MSSKDTEWVGQDKLSLDIESWALKAQAECEAWPGCKRVIINDLRHTTTYRTEYFRVVFDDTWISITNDPGVYEMKMPFTDLDLWDEEKQLDRVQKFVFDIPASLKRSLKPSPYRGMGHVNYEIESLLHGKTFRLRQLLGDRYNNPQLAMGIHESDTLNANAFASRGPDFQLGFAITLWEMEEGKFETAKDAFMYFQKMGIFLSNHSNEIELKVQSDEDEDEDEVIERVEDRAARAQNKAEDFPIFAKLTPARLDYLDDKPFVPLRHYRKGVKALSKAQRVALYKIYIEECGLNFTDYIRFIPKDWRRIPDVLSVIHGELDGRTLFDDDCWEPFWRYGLRVRADLFSKWANDNYVGTPALKKALFSVTFAKQLMTARKFIDFYNVRSFLGPKSKDLNEFAAREFTSNVIAIEKVFLSLNPSDAERTEFGKLKARLEDEAKVDEKASSGSTCLQNLVGG